MLIDLQGRSTIPADSTPGHSSEVIVSIQYLRALAALSVVFYHANIRAGVGYNFAAAGVDLFFVISGVIMWHTTSIKPTNAKTFLWHRLVRIAPLYWVITLVKTANVWIGQTASPENQISLGHLVMSLLFIPHLDQNGYLLPVVLPGWTLNYEMFFYFVFASAMFLSGALRIIAVSLVMICLALIGLVMPEWARTAVTVMYTSPLLLEFITGMWLGYLWMSRKMPGFRGGIILIVLGLLCLGVYSAIYGFDEYPAPEARWFFWGMPAMFILCGAMAVEGGTRFLRSSLVQKLLKPLGDASYSVYLLHGLVITVVEKVMGFGTLFVPACLAATTVAGILSFHLVERPLTKLLRSLPMIFRRPYLFGSPPRGV